MSDFIESLRRLDHSRRISPPTGGLTLKLGPLFSPFQGLVTALGQGEKIQVYHINNKKNKGDHMTEFAILRVSKLKTLTHVQKAHQHNTREAYSSNVDQSRSHLNRVINRYKMPPHDAVQALLKKHKIKARKNAVHALEYALTFTPEAEDRLRSEKQLNDWYKENVAFIEERHGKENVLQVAVHRDESTMHLQIIVIPLIEKMYRGKQRMRLDATHFVDGSKLLSELQTQYAERMSKFGLERGLKDSKRKHKTLKAFNQETSAELLRANEIVEEIEKEADRDSSKFNFMSNAKRKLKKLKTTLSEAFMRIASLEKENKALRSEREALRETYNAVDTLTQKVKELEAQSVRINALSSQRDIENETLRFQVDQLTQAQNQSEHTHKRTHEHSNDLSM